MTRPTLHESYVGDPPTETTRFTAWRLSSTYCAAVDRIVIGLGVLMVAVTLVVSVATWPSDRVLVAPGRLEFWFEVVVVPCWIWLFGSGVLIYGVRIRKHRSRNHRGKWERRPRASLVIGAVVLGATCLAAFVGGLVIGTAKGSLRHVGHRYEVSSASLDSDRWVTVSAHAYRIWEARFLRLDSMMSLFGFVIILGGAHFLAMHGRVKAGQAAINSA